MGAITWKADVPQGGSVELFTRSGNTSRADDTWSAWSKAYTKSEGLAVTSPSARYLQWKAVLKSSNANRTPKLNEVSIAYREKNLAPTIVELLVKLPNESFSSSEYQDDSQFQYFGKSNRTKNQGQSRPASQAQKPQSNSGNYTVTWYVEDDNADQLKYAVWYKAETDANWKLLKEDLKGNQYYLDGRNCPMANTGQN